MDFALGLGNPDPDLIGAVSHAWVYLRRLRTDRRKRIETSFTNILSVRSRQ